MRTIEFIVIFFLYACRKREEFNDYSSTKVLFYSTFFDIEHKERNNCVHRSTSHFTIEHEINVKLLAK